MFGLLSKMADEGLEIFIILTTDSTLLAKQTFDRAFINLRNCFKTLIASISHNFNHSYIAHRLTITS